VQPGCSAVAAASCTKMRCREGGARRQIMGPARRQSTGVEKEIHLSNERANVEEGKSDISPSSHPLDLIKSIKNMNGVQIKITDSFMCLDVLEGYGIELSSIQINHDIEIKFNSNSIVLSLTGLEFATIRYNST
jgi:hypothetical protein